MANDNKVPKSQGLDLLSSIFFITAFILMWTGSYNCNFIKFTSTAGSSEPIVRELGIWYYQFYSYVATVDGQYIVQTCSVYPDSIDIDASWKAARAFSSLSFIFAMIALIIKSFQMCSSKRHSADPYTRSGNAQVLVWFLLTGVCQAFTLLFLNSNACKSSSLVQMTDLTFEDSCSIAKGAKLTISSTVFWLAAAAMGFQALTAWKGEQEQIQADREARRGGLDEPLNP